MQVAFDIQKYMTGGVERVLKDALRATLKNPGQTAFLTRFALASKKASEKRKNAEEKSEHIPPFLIASVVSSVSRDGSY